MVVETAELWPLGVTFAFTASFIGAVGDNLVRKAYVGCPVKPTAKVMMKSKYFVYGILCTIVLDTILTMAALVFAPASAVSPFAGLHIFWAIIVAHFWLNETFGKRDAVGAVCIVIGVGLVVTFAGKAATIESIDDFNLIAESTGASVYAYTSSFLTLLCIAFSIESVVNKLLPVSLAYQFRKLATAFCCGLNAGNTNICAKLLCILFTSLLASPGDTLSTWSVYLVMLVSFVVGSLQIIYLNISLMRYEAIFVIPITNSVLVSEAACGSVLLLQERPNNLYGFVTGVSLAVVGIIFMAAHSPNQAQSVTSADLGKDFMETRQVSCDSIRSSIGTLVGGAKNSMERTKRQDRTTDCDTNRSRHDFSQHMNSISNTPVDSRGSRRQRDVKDSAFMGNKVGYKRSNSAFEIYNLDAPQGGEGSDDIHRRHSEVDIETLSRGYEHESFFKWLKHAIYSEGAHIYSNIVDSVPPVPLTTTTVLTNAAVNANKHKYLHFVQDNHRENHVRPSVVGNQCVGGNESLGGNESVDCN